MSARSLKVVFAIALLVATLDALGAIVVYKADPTKMFQFIAMGIFGLEAFAGGTTMVVYGIVLHLFIAFCWTALFFMIYPHVKFVSTANKPLIAIGYGVLIWMVMNMIVLPMSHVPASPFNLQKALVGALILIVTVAFPVVYLTARHYRR